MQPVWLSVDYTPEDLCCHVFSTLPLLHDKAIEEAIEKTWRLVDLRAKTGQWEWEAPRRPSVLGRHPPAVPIARTSFKDGLGRAECRRNHLDGIRGRTPFRPVCELARVWRWLWRWLAVTQTNLVGSLLIQTAAYQSGAICLFRCLFRASLRTNEKMHSGHPHFLKLQPVYLRFKFSVIPQQSLGEGRNATATRAVACGGVLWVNVSGAHCRGIVLAVGCCNRIP